MISVQSLILTVVWEGPVRGTSLRQEATSSVLASCSGGVSFRTTGRRDAWTELKPSRAVWRPRLAGCAASAQEQVQLISGICAGRLRCWLTYLDPPWLAAPCLAFSPTKFTVHFGFDARVFAG